MKTSIVFSILATLPFWASALPSPSSEAETLVASVGASVVTTSGTVVGHAAKNRTGVSEYLGIRYALSADGARRFQPPVSLKSTSRYVASDYVSALF
jgi:hypothetical protein